MRIHLELLNDDDEVVSAQTFERPYIHIGGGEHDDFPVEGVSRSILVIRTDGHRVGLHSDQGVQRIGIQTVVPLGEHRLRIRVYRRLDEMRQAPGACPGCGERLSSRTVGGAYRSMASSEMHCDCGLSILTLSAAAATVGSFSARPQDEWLKVTVAVRCPTCLQPMRRSTFRTEHGEAQVERCERCQVVVFDAEDRVRLTDEPS